MALSSVSSSDNIYYFRHRTRRRVFGFIRFVIVFFIVYEIITVMVVSSYTVASVSMRPLLYPGDRVAVSQLEYGARVPFTRLRLPAVHPPQRGDVVLSHPAYFNPESWYLRIADPIVRFFTLQRIRPGAHDDLGNRLLIKRVVAVPGDTVKMDNFTIYVKPKGASAFSSEFELTGSKYDITHDRLPDGWPAALPLSGTMKAQTMGPNEYFLVGDNRSASSDSVAWGPVPAAAIVGQVVFRYWPLKAIGVP